MKFKSLKINDWKQFDAVDIEFHDRLTILTGANASGKTTLLNMLAGCFGWGFQELSTPTKLQTGEIEFLRPVPQSLLLAEKSLENENFPIGELVYDDGSKIPITIPYGYGPEYHLNLSLLESVRGMYVPSERPEFAYVNIREIPSTRKMRVEAFNLLDSARRRGTSIIRCIKEILLVWGVFGFASKSITPTKEYADLYIGFEDVLKKILPVELGFKGFSIRQLEIVLATEFGDFMIEAVSGGIGALIDLGLQIYLLSGDASDSFPVLIDEVETHLHATMQRELLPNFLEAFPNVQFIVSTHSPLVVSSVRDSSVYVLKHNDKRRVESKELKIADKARGAADILRDVLGVSFTMPVWAEEKLKEINEKYSKLDIDENTFASLRKELTEIGLEDLVPYSIDTVLSSK